MDRPEGPKPVSLRSLLAAVVRDLQDVTAAAETAEAPLRVRVFRVEVAFVVEDATGDDALVDVGSARLGGLPPHAVSRATVELVGEEWGPGS